MVTSKDADINQEMHKRLKLDLSEVQGSIDRIIPVYEIDKRYCQIVANGVATNATAANVYTTPTEKEFYLTAVNLNLIKDATSTSTSSFVAVTINGASLAVIRIPSITLTAQTLTANLIFPFPIKIDKGTTITVNNSTNVANIGASCSIVGYVVEKN